MKNIKSILWGILLVGAGVVIGLKTFGVIDFDFFFDGWWTFIIIIPCTINLFKSRNKIFDLTGIFIGVVLLLVTRDIVTVEMLRKLVVPCVLVFFGLFLIFKDLFRGRIKAEIERLNADRARFISKAATFASESLRFDNEVVEGLELNAAFGSINCDLRNAVIEHDIVINANASFGGIDIYLPPYVKAVVSSVSLFGGVSDKTTYEKNPNSPKVYINSVCLFGGVDLK